MELKANLKRILILTDWYEPGFKAGGPIRSCVNFANQLKCSYDIYILTRDRDLGEKNAYPFLEFDKWLYKDGILIYYVSSKSLTAGKIFKIIQDVRPDYLYLNSMYSFLFTVIPLLMKRFIGYKKSIVLAPRGMLKESALQIKKVKKSLYLAALNFLKIQRYITFQATNDQEEEDIKKVFKEGAKIEVLPNFPDEPKRLVQTPFKNKGELNILFVGRIHPVKNLLFVLECLKELDFKVTLTIIGLAEDILYWDKCNELIHKFPQNIKAVYEGNVPHAKLEYFMLKNHIFFLPTEGENFGHAIFEALTFGLPALVSDQTPWRSLFDKKAGFDLPLTSRDQFVKALYLYCEMDEEAFISWRKGAWSFANNFILSSDVKKKYLSFFS